MSVYATNAAIKANWLIWCIESEDGFTAMGSRNINQVDLQADYEYEEFSMFASPYASGGFGGIRSYDLKSNLRNITMVKGKTELEALCSLITTFRTEELEELRAREAEARALAAAKAEKKKVKELERHTRGNCKKGCSLCAQQELELLRQAHDDLMCEDDCDYCAEENDYYGCECCR